MEGVVVNHQVCSITVAAAVIVVKGVVVNHDVCSITVAAVVIIMEGIVVNNHVKTHSREAR